jgi:putative ABC transport system substrate-binding protein
MTARALIRLLALALLALPLAAQAQSGKIARIGWIALPPGPTSAQLEAFRRGMRERGWTEGENLAIDIRWGDRDRARRYREGLRRRDS